jgi:hypothetical protein
MSIWIYLIWFIISLLFVVICFKIIESIYYILLDKIEKNKYHIIDLKLSGDENQIHNLLEEFKYMDMDMNPMVEITINIDKPDKIERYAIGTTDRVDFINCKVLRLFLKISENINDDIKNDLLNLIQQSLIKHILGISLAYNVKMDEKKYTILVIVVDDKLPDEFKNVLKIVNEST